MSPCRFCDGKGETAHNDRAPRDPQRDVYRRCAWCGGSGRGPSVEEDVAWTELSRRSA